MELFKASKVTVMTATIYPISCLLCYWESHVPSTPADKFIPNLFLSTLFLTVSSTLMILVIKMRQSYLSEAFDMYPDLRLQGWMTFDPKSVSCLSTWMAIAGIICSVCGAHGGIDHPAVHDTFVILGGVGTTFYLTAQVGLSYTMGELTGRKVSRFRNFLRWCCLFVLTVWMILVIVVANEVYMDRKSISDESLNVLKVVNLFAEAAVLLLLSAFVASFAHEFEQVTVQIVKVNLLHPKVHRAKLEKKKIYVSC
ncbi:uncharacterized protein LOC135940197 [Cloeon dipterum]|uniref:uncharacterized protein LOC135940197 n=1 Tax=Cloeon dipterum TaxID=197152 RepID=UPI00321FC5E9